MKIIKSSGKSMTPFFLQEKLLVIKKVHRQSKIHIGDIVWRSIHGRSTVHRVVEIKKESVLTKGDLENKDDGWVKKNKISGIVSGFYSGKKYYSLETKKARVGNYFFAQVSKLDQGNIIKKAFILLISNPFFRKLLKRLSEI